MSHTRDPRRTMPLRLAAVAAAGLLAACGGEIGRTEAPESLLLVTIDTLRADRLGCYGSSEAETPVLDRLAAEGVRFDQAATVAPLTLPAHATILTGLTPPGHGVRHNGLYALPGDATTLAEFLAGHGYRTAAFVGAYPLASPFGLSQGFEVYDERFETAEGRGFYYPERPAEKVTEAARAWLDALPGETPFFAWVHYFDPHAKYLPPPPYDTRFAGRLYDGEIAYTDAQLGRLLEFLTEAKRWERTLVVVTADHGESLGEHGEETHGLFVYEATIRVPLIIRPPGPRGGADRPGRGRTIAEPVSLVDLFPTAIDILGLEGMPEGVQGESLAGWINTEPSGSREIYAESLMPRLEYGWAELTSLRRGALKWIEAPRPELYDLSADPAELTNLADRRTEEAGRFRARLAAARDELSVAGLGSESRRPLDAEEVAKLQSLGYLQGGTAPGAPGPEAGGKSDGTPRDPKDGVRALQRIDEAKALVRQGRRDDAIALFRSVVESEPRNLIARKRLAETLISAGRGKEADALLSEIPASEIAAPWLPRLRARARQAMGDADGAVAFFREAIRREPDPTPPAMQAAQMLRGLGRRGEALEALEAALEGGGDRALLGEFAGDLARETGDAVRAGRHYRTALRANPHLRAAWANYSRLAFLRPPGPEDPEEVRALAGAAGDVAGAKLVLGLLDYTTGRPASAAVHFRAARDLAPRDPDIACFLGLALTDSGDTDAAEKVLVPLARERPNLFQVQRALGLLREAQGRREEAVALLRRALELRPDDAVSEAALDRLRTSGS